MIKLSIALLLCLALFSFGRHVAAQPFLSDDEPDLQALRAANASEPAKPIFTEPKPKLEVVKETKPINITQPLVKAPDVQINATNETAVTAAPDLKGPPPLLNMSIKGTTVTISATGDVKTSKPELEIKTSKVAQLIGGFVRLVKNLVETGKESAESDVPMASRTAQKKLKQLKQKKADDSERAKAKKRESIENKTQGEEGEEGGRSC